MVTSQENLQHICSVNMYPTFQSLLENMSNNDYINLACALGLRQPLSDSFKVSRKGRSVNCNSDVAPNLPGPIPFSFSNQCARAALSGEGIRRCQDGWRMRSAGSSMLCEADDMWEPFPSRFIPARHPDDRLSYGDIPGNICQTCSGQWREFWIPTMQETMDREYSATMCKSHSIVLSTSKLGNNNNNNNNNSQTATTTITILRIPPVNACLPVPSARDGYQEQPPHLTHTCALTAPQRHSIPPLYTRQRAGAMNSCIRTLSTAKSNMMTSAYRGSSWHVLNRAVVRIYGVTVTRKRWQGAWGTAESAIGVVLGFSSRER